MECGKTPKKYLDKIKPNLAMLILTAAPYTAKSSTFGGGVGASSLIHVHFARHDNGPRGPVAPAEFFQGKSAMVTVNKVFKVFN